MMKVRYSYLMVMSLLGMAQAQMPTAMGGGTPPAAVPNSFDASGSAAKPQSDDPTRRGEPANPQLLGMEIPVLDPASDTLSYNGGRFDVGNNALVRARFEKYLQQIPDDSSESKRYRSLINKILLQTERSGNDRRYTIGSDALINIGRGLYEADKYPGDGGQAGMLASAIVSALDAQRSNLKREKQNEKYDAELNALIKKADVWQNNNVRRKSSISKGEGGGSPGGDINALRVAHAMSQVTEKKAQKTTNTAENKANLAAAKVNYQSVLVTLLLSRRFDHAMIGARVYRHVFREGDARLKLDKNSKANEVFTGGVGMPPTINSIDSAASTARREVDQSMQAVHSMLAQNKLGEATQHLIEAVAIGEYMQSVATLPVEARQRIARYWTLRKRALSALNARDYDTVEEVAKKMKEMDEDFDDSMLLSFTAGKKRQSNLAIRNAAKALRAGNEEDFNRYIQEAGAIWPRNPKLDEGEEMIAKIDEGDDVKDEFRRLYDAGEFRRIANEEKRFEIVATDPELAKQYKDTLALVMKMDGIIEQLQSAADQDVKIGPCAAYEKMLELQKEDPRYAEDEKMTRAMHNFESRAHDFVEALREADLSAQKREYGSALSSYYRAQCFYPQSKLAADSIRSIMEIIVKAQYD